MQIDHIVPILKYVWEKADPKEDIHNDRAFEAISVRDAKTAANEEENLRVLCGDCNRDRINSSRDTDTSPAWRWLD